MTIKQLGGVFGRNPTFNDVTIEGTLTFEGNIDIDSDINFGDNDKATFGDGSDLQIYHNGTDNYVDAAGAGHLYLQSQGDDKDVKILSDDGSGGLTEYFRADGSIGKAQMFYYGTKTLETSNTGVDITGTLTADGLTVESASSPQDATISSTATNGAARLVLSNDAQTYRLLVNGTSSDRFQIFDGTAAAARFAIDTNGDISFYDTSASQAFFWDASAASLGIGTTSPSALLHIASSSAQLRIEDTSGTGTSQINFADNADGNIGILSYDHSDNSMQFRVNDSERMRVDADGNLLIATTVTAPDGATGIKIIPDYHGANKPWTAISTAAYQTETCLSVYSTAVTAYRFKVDAAGRIYAVYTTISALSDERVKENIRDLDDGLAKVMQLQPRKFDWKEGHGKDISNDRGFIAQEFEQVFPDMIEEWENEAPEGEEPYKAVNANLIPTLVKAIQEQQDLIESLTARIAALEGAN